MNNNLLVETYKELTPVLISEIRDLESVCNANDDTQYQLFLENMFNADRDIEFIYFLRNKGKLVSFLLLFFPDITELEVYGFTHPDYRKQGLFTTLIKSVQKTFSKYKNYTLLYVCDPSSADGIAFLKKKDCKLKETEYVMELNWQVFDSYLKKSSRNAQIFHMKTADLSHLDEICGISNTMYDSENVKSSEFVKQTILSESREQLVGLVNGQIIAICTIGREEDTIMINGLAVSKEFQGKGYGRLMINQVLSYIKVNYQDPVRLEVSSVNDKAFNLYKSIGFEQKESYGYYL